MALLALLPLIGFVLFWQRLQQISVSSATLHAVGALIVVLFVGGMLDALPATRWLLLTGGTALLLFELARNRARSFDSLKSVPMVAFIALCVTYYFVHGNSELRYYDEFSHWGIYFKDIVASGGFWGADTNALHPRYPPGAPLWQYFFVFSEIPKESTAYFGQFILLLAPLLVLFEKLKWKQGAWALGITVLILFAYGNFGHGIASIYIDHVIAAFLAGIFLNFIADLHSRSDASLISYAIPLTALALIKDTGFFFALSLSAIFAVLIVIRGMRDSERSFKKSSLAAMPVLLIFLAVPTAATGVWALERNAVGAERDVMSVSGLFGILTGNTKVDDPERAHIVRILFPEVFFKQQLSKNLTSDHENAFTTDSMPKFKDRFRFTTASFLLIFIAWSVFLIWKVVDPPDRLIWATGFAGLFGIALGYLLMLYLSYQYVFPRHDAVYLASYIRYVHSVTLPMLLAAFAPLLPVFSQRRASTASGEAAAATGSLGRHTASVFTIALLALLVFEPLHYQTLIPGSPKNLSNFRDYIKGTADALRSIVGRKSLWLYMPDTDKHGYMSRIMLYELAPTPTTVNRDFEYFEKPTDEILAEWAKFDFVWVAHQDTQVDEKLSELVGPDLAERLYRVKGNAAGGFDIELVNPENYRGK